MRLGQQLASVAAVPSPDAAAQANMTAGQSQAALATTRGGGGRRAHAASTEFCDFSIRIGPRITDIPNWHIPIVIGPLFIHFRAPCFLSGDNPKPGANRH